MNKPASKKDKVDPGSPFYALKGLRDRMAEEGKEAPAKAADHKVTPDRRRTPADRPGQDDELSFHRLMSGVTPLDGRDAPAPRGLPDPRRTRTRAREEAEEAARREDDAVREHLHSLVHGPAAPDPPGGSGTAGTPPKGGPKPRRPKKDR